LSAPKAIPPERLRAINRVDEALDSGAIQRHQDLIIGLALEMEKLRAAK
jgi:hypothetical protein